MALGFHDITWVYSFIKSGFSVCAAWNDTRGFPGASNVELSILSSSVAKRLRQKLADQPHNLPMNHLTRPSTFAFPIPTNNPIARHVCFEQFHSARFADRHKAEVAGVADLQVLCRRFWQTPGHIGRLQPCTPMKFCPPIIQATYWSAIEAQVNGGIGPQRTGSTLIIKT
jgi:hypothetical protein